MIVLFEPYRSQERIMPGTTEMRVGPSGNEHHPIRIEVPGRAPLDVTRAELTALVHESRMYLMRTFPTPPLGRISNSGG